MSTFSEGKIYQAVMVAMTEIGAIGKNKRNPQQNYSFRGIDDVLNNLQPALMKAKMFIVPRIISMVREERATKAGGVLIYTTVHGEYDFVSAEDGSKITASTYGEGMDSSDKSTNKAMSAALKYAVIQTLAIPTEYLVDSEKDTPEPAAKTTETKQAQPKPQKVKLANNADSKLATEQQKHALLNMATREWKNADTGEAQLYEMIENVYLESFAKLSDINARDLIKNFSQRIEEWESQISKETANA